ncbi:uncharacterized protein (DUF488 family) [Altererythrobacter atlanticus]|uniref:Uncharacterized protein n=1 Tax=Croceibacterium atlanticum TaxID=1267766 RepID=A0A0F7KRE8_9SPHN|nr:DUF488 domain-containing protein [Croceibacterium atlanticum]AKH41782.1 hypothetical protein WYH_00728 [Croceibacterium atlanticum]MBB5733247.1 uncharacterized protein (DUF488 family) [Croceibacterium atlanticum]
MARVFTIGYAQASQPALVAALEDAGVQLLADIRALPNSRRPGFSKNSLKAAVEETGIAYRHFRHLGTPAEGRAAARRGDHAELARIYSGQLELPEALAQMAELRELAQKQPVCLLCYCALRSECHRGLLIEALLPDFEIVDLHPVTG